jgi:hypothetical protein
MGRHFGIPQHLDTEPDEDANHSCLRIVALASVIAIVFLIVIALVFITDVLIAAPAHARDDGRYANEPLHQWFDQLASGKGLCCSFADGVKVEDVDWSVQGEGQQCRKVGDGDYQGKYCVRLLGEWWLVPETAVITEPNKFGPPVVWPVFAKTGEDGQTQVLTDIRCFLPGAGA